MPKSVQAGIRRCLVLSIVCSVWLIMTATVYARETNFRPAFGDVSQVSPGPEKVLVTEDGGISILSYAGEMSTSSPFFIPGSVVVTSPVLTDLTRDSYYEIMVAARNSVGQYALYAYDGDGNQLGSTAFGSEEITFDPVVRTFAGSKKDELYLTAGTRIYRVVIDVTNNIFVKTEVAATGYAAGLTIEPVGKTLLIAHFPDRPVVNIYSINTQNSSLPLTLLRTLTVSAPFVYPPIFGYTTTATSSVSGLYGVTSAAGFLGINTTTGNILVGFPQALGGTPVDGPVLSDVDTRPGDEWIVPLASGQQKVFSLNGQPLAFGSKKKYFQAQNNVQRMNVQKGLLKNISGIGTILVSGVAKTLTSIYGSVVSYIDRFSEPDILIRYGNTAIVNGGVLNFGRYPAHTNTDMAATIVNTGSRDLVLSGTPAITISGPDAADWQILEQPRTLVKAYESNRFAIRFHPTSEGVKTATVSIQNSDSDNDPLQFTITGSGHAWFKSLIVEKANLNADATDVQTATLVIGSEQVNAVDRAYIIVNYPVAGTTNTTRGYFQWTRNTNTFTSVGGATYGQSTVNLRPFNAANPESGSNYFVNEVDQSVRVVFRWTVNAGYGALTDNRVAYSFGETGTAYQYAWRVSQANFRVGTPIIAAQFVSLAVDRQSLNVNPVLNNDLQTATLVLRSSDLNAMDVVSIIVNYPSPQTTNRTRGYFTWTPGGGFASGGGAYYGQDTVTLLPTNSTNPTLGSQMIYDAQSQTVRCIFRWRVRQNYGAIADNDIAYYVSERVHNHTLPWRVVDTSFSVSGALPLSSFDSLFVSSSTVRANNTDIQAVHLVIHSENIVAVDAASVIVNYPRANTTNTARGYFQWTRAQGFTSVGGAYYGQNKVVLLPINTVNPSTGSQVIENVAEQKITVVYRFKILPGTGTITDNDMAYYFTESSNNYAVGWRIVDTSFSITP